MADITTELTGGASADGFSAPYQIAVATAGLVYLVLGLGVLYRLLSRTFRPSVVMLTLVVLTFGTDLFHYGTYDNTFSHVYSFFLFACFLTASSGGIGIRRAIGQRLAVAAGSSR